MGGNITITGSNFGAGRMPGEGASFGEWLASTGRGVTIDGGPCVVQSWANNEIVCTAAEGVSASPRLAVFVADLSNEEQTGLVAYLPPTLSGFLEPNHGDSSGGYSVVFTGANFGPASSLLTLYFNHAGRRYPCVVTRHDHELGVCTVSPGAGADLAVTVETAGRPSSANVTAAPILFSYHAPSVTGVVAVDLSLGYPAVGNFLVTVQGSSFTADPVVTVSGRPCQAVAGTVVPAHSSVNCTMPPNYGKRHPVVVSAANQRSAPYFFNYDPPRVREVLAVVDMRDTQGRGAYFNAKEGTEVIISGANFGDGEGDIEHGTITLNGTECIRPVFVRDDEIRCVLPRDQYVGMSPLVVTTWNPALFNRSDPEGRQASEPYFVFVECPIDYYGRENETCAECPEEALCYGGSAEPFAREGYFKEDRTTYLQCRPFQACLGGSDVDNQCRKGYTGVACSECDGAFYRLDVYCKPCPNLAWLLIVGFVVIVTLLLLVGVWLNQRRINLAALGIGVDFAQMVAMFVSLNFAWPKELQTLYSAMSVFNFNIQIAAPEVGRPWERALAIAMGEQGCARASVVPVPTPPPLLCLRGRLMWAVVARVWCVCARARALQCTLNWTFASKWIIIASMPILAVACTLLVAIIVSAKNFVVEKYQYWRGKTLSPPTEIDALFGLLFASFYYLYLQVGNLVSLAAVWWPGTLARGPTYCPHLHRCPPARVGSPPHTPHTPHPTTTTTCSRFFAHRW